VGCELANNLGPSGDGDERQGYLADTYALRFTRQELEAKQRIWDILVSSFFSRWFPTSSTVLDLGAGNGEFINAVNAKRRIAVDFNPETRGHLDQGIEFVEARSTDLSILKNASVDVVFTSNFFEHLRDSQELLDTLRECRRILVPDGRLLVLMPNIRYVREAFWDYLDHTLPLTERSLAEALNLTGFEVEVSHAKFVPYTVKDSRLPTPRWAMVMYLKTPILWKAFGRQMFIVARLGSGSPSVGDASRT
jgi:SAM-dependent methyltransferase